MKQITRREFLAAGMTSAVLLCFPGPSAGFDLWGKKTRWAAGPADITGSVFKNSAPKNPWKWSVEAFDYIKHADRSVTCAICPHGCRLLPGDRGLCRSRVNIDGVLYSLVYGNPCSINVDPVEKKPLFHFLPQTTAFSIAGAGCNFRCLNCQNWEISQAAPEALRHYELFPDGVVQAVGQSGAASIAYTYSEAITFFEYMYDTARLARKQGIKSLLISNGYISRNPLSALCDVIDGANINLKSFDDALYRKLNGGRLAPVLDTLETLHRQGVHLEVTHLVVPGYTDDTALFRRMCAWILEALGPDHPLHLLRFFPQYRLNRLAPTPVETLTRFRNLARCAGIRYVYVGNVPDHEGVHTRCHNCNHMLIFRRGYNVTLPGMENGRCAACGTAIPGVWT